MTVTYVGNGTAAANTTSVSRNWPSSTPAAGQLAVLTVLSGHPDDVLPTVGPDEWIRVGSMLGGGGSFGEDAGPRRLTFFVREVDGTEGAVQVSIASGSGSMVFVALCALSRSGGEGWSYEASFGQDTSSGTGFSATGSAIEFQSGDFVVLGFAHNNDLALQSAEAISASGITFGTITQRIDVGALSGNDSHLGMATGPVTAGSGNVAPTITATLSTAATGVAGVLRIRDTAASTVTTTYDPDLSRVRIDATDLDNTAATALIERSTNEINWTTVRGGIDVLVDPDSLAVPVSDYEFISDESNVYRLTAYNGDGVIVNRNTDTIAPALADVWIKSIARPFLNRPVKVVEHSEITRAARSGVFDIVGRSFPVAVSDVRGSRQWTLTVVTETPSDATSFDIVLASGDPIFLHVPAVAPFPGGYYTIGDTTQSRRTARGVRRYFDLPLTEIAAPGADVVGSTSTWQTVLSTYATWADLIADVATWADLLELIGDPTEVVVP